MDYDNFDLRIGYPQNGRYPIEVTDSPRGARMRQPIWQEFPLSDPGFQTLLDYLPDLVATGDDVRQLGSQLRALLFPDEVWTLFYAGRAAAREAGRGLRLRLRIDPPALSALPWEYCFDETFHFLALQRETPVVRYIAEPFADGRVAAPRPVKILAAIAAPSDLGSLGVAGEEARLRDALSGLNDQIELTILRRATPRSLHQALAARPDIFHFVGHGMFTPAGAGALALENDSGLAQPVDADQLMVLLSDSGVKVVVLTACQTASPRRGEAIMGVAPALVRAEIAAVIAMQLKLPDQTAASFSRDLYHFLASGRPLDEAVTEMRIGAYTSTGDKVFWGIPTLFMRAPDGIIWQPAAESARSENITMDNDSKQASQESGHISFDNISNSNISIGGNIAGRDLHIKNDE